MPRRSCLGFHFFWFPLFVWVRRLWREMWWPMGKRDQTLSQFCSCCCDKTPWWKSLKGEQVYASSQFRQQFVPVVESLWQGLKAAGHVHRQEQRERMSANMPRAQTGAEREWVHTRLCSTHFLNSHSSGSPTMAMVTRTVTGSSHFHQHIQDNPPQHIHRPAWPRQPSLSLSSQLVLECC